MQCSSSLRALRLSGALLVCLPPVVASSTVPPDSVTDRQCAADPLQSFGDSIASNRVLTLAIEAAGVVDSAFRVYAEAYWQSYGEVDVRPQYSTTLDLLAYSLELDHTNATAWLRRGDYRRLNAHAEGLTRSGLERAKAYAECAVHFAEQNGDARVRAAALELIEQLEVEFTYVVR